MVFRRKFFVRNLNFERIFPLRRRRRRWSVIMNGPYYSNFKRANDLYWFRSFSFIEKEKLKFRRFNQHRIKFKKVLEFFIKSRFTVNNYFLTLVNSKGEVLVWHSSGKEGFTSTSTKRKSYSLERVSKKFAFLVKQKVEIKLCVFIAESKFNYKMRGLLRHLRKENVNISSVFFKPRVSHNGLRKVRQRRC